MRKFTIILLVGIVALMSSCRKDFDTVPSSGGLEFSKQTVYLDTIFTGISSSTYMLKVYNRSNDDISIPAIRLEKGDASKYRIMVDGMMGIDGKGKYFPNVEVLAKDSLFIFIETTVDILETNPDYTYTDRILFDAGSNEQAVDLVTLVQDAKFIFPNRDLNGFKEVLTLEGNPEPTDIEGHTLLTPEELNWTNEKPYVVYGFAHVPAGQTLHIEQGTKVHFHANSGIIVDQNAHIVIDGQASDYGPDGQITVDREVTFEGDRLEPGFSEVPGQWTALLILSTSGNTINHLTLKNSAIGIYLPGDATQNFHPQVQITNSQIYNSANFGIYGLSANIVGENIAISYAGQSCFAGLEGGNYTMTHCSLNNDWSNPDQVSVWFDNYTVNEAQVKQPQDLTVVFRNSIIYGSNRVQLYLDIFDVNFDQTAFQNCLIKFNDDGTSLEDNPDYAFIRNEAGNNIKNQDPLFANPNRNWLLIPDTSPAFNAGNTAFQTTGNTDYFGIGRGTTPDLGAYNAFTPI